MILDTELKVKTRKPLVVYQSMYTNLTKFRQKISSNRTRVSKYFAAYPHFC